MVNPYVSWEESLWFFKENKKKNNILTLADMLATSLWLLCLWKYFVVKNSNFIKEENHLSDGEKQDGNLECLDLARFKSQYFLTFDILTKVGGGW